MSKSLNLCFCGSSEFSVPFLKDLANNPNFTLKAVLTRCDQPANRGKKLFSNPVKSCARSLNLKIFEPKNLTAAANQLELKNHLKDLNIDAVIVVSYGLIIPESLLSVCPLGWINVHASLLPRWRGAGPIARALLSGDKESGVSIMQIEKGLDTGPFYLQKSCSIDSDETSASLTGKLYKVGIEALTETLMAIKNSHEPLDWISQPNTGQTYAEKICKSEAHISWIESAEIIDRKVRGYFPWPIAFWQYSGEMIKILKARLVCDSCFESEKNFISFAPGTILENNKNALIIKTGNGAIALEKLQWPNRKALLWSELRHQPKLQAWQKGFKILDN